VILFDMCPFCRRRAEAILKERKVDLGIRPSIQDLVVKVAAEYKLTATELVSMNNSPVCVVPRRKVARLARQYRYSYPEIGKVINRHHTTVMNLVNEEGHAIETATHRIRRKAPREA
jgi:chromosomal replication initiation ATPase DnaA